MKKNLWIVLGLVILIIIAAGIYKFNFTNDDIYVEYNGEMMKIDDYNALEEHCKMMPDMAWCEWFDFAIVDTGTHTMDHAAMVTDEISFLSEMIPHHQEAIDTSATLLTQTQNTGLKLILVNIMSGQSSEIKMMKNRLSDNYSGSEYKPMYMPMMRDTKWITDVLVLEKMYMEDMIVHHQWAVDMATKLLTLMKEQDPLIKLTEEIMAQRQVLKDFAQNIIDAQTKEIAQFQELLKSY
jgi:uncharacterized protein (DUF305 family)